MSKFWQGYCVAVCFQLLIQDLIGKEQYIKALDLLWMDTRWWYWLIAIAFFFAIPYFEQYLTERDAKFKARMKELEAKLISDMSRSIHSP